jgi:hypothetical protein
MAVHDAGDVSGKRRFPGQQFVQRDTERVDVTGWGWFLPGEQFRRQVRDGAYDDPGRRKRRVPGNARDTEVGQPDLPAVEQHVGRLEVAVHDPRRVRGGQSVADLRAQPRRRTGGLPGGAGAGPGRRPRSGP